MRDGHTLRDVAQAAQVSVATVSRVATGRAHVSPAIARRVRQAAIRLGVDLSRKISTRVIGFILSNREMLHPFHSRLLAGAAAYCAAEGYNILYLPVHYDVQLSWREIRLPQVVLRHDLVHGFIVTGVNSQSLLDFLTYKRLPFAVLGNNIVGEWRRADYDSAWFNDSAGAYEATCYLRALGHRDIWYVGNCSLPWFARRYEGYCQAMNEGALNPRLSDIDSSRDSDIGYLAMKSILNQREPVTAVFAPGDAIAQGAYKALRDSGLQVPQDVSVIGFNDIEAGALDPPLTTVRIFVEHVGKKLAQMLVNRITQPDLAVQHWSIPIQLIKRASCQSLQRKAASTPAVAVQDSADP